MNQRVESAVTLFLLIIFINCRVNAEEIANPFISLLETQPDQQTPSSSSIPSSPVFPVFTRVLNAFPPSEVDGSHVSVVLDEDKIEGVAYGRVLEKETMIRAVEDFVIDFKNPNNGGVYIYMMHTPHSRCSELQSSLVQPPKLCPK